MRAGARTALLAAVVGLMLLDTARAADKPTEELQDVERALARDKALKSNLDRKAAESAAELDRLRATLVALGADVQEQEDLVDGLRVELRALDQGLTERRGKLTANEAQLATVLGAFQRLVRRPPAAWLVTPERPNEAVRAAILMRAAFAHVEGAAQELRRELDALTRLRRQTDDYRRRFEQATAELGKRRDRLSDMVARQANLVQETEAEREAARARIAKLAQHAQSLRDLIAKLPSSKKAGRTTAALPTLDWRLPARGRIATGYGDKTLTGAASRGLVIETTEDAVVVAPQEGEVMYAGPFRGYGLILIIQHGQEYHTLLAGLSSIASPVGQWLAAGEPVGRMGNAGETRPQLYVEIRRKGEPVDPQPWLKTDGVSVKRSRP